MKRLLIFVLLTAVHLTSRTQQLEVSISSINNNLRIHLKKSGTLIANCGLSPAPNSIANPYDNVRISFDQAAIIFSDLLYLPISELLTCRAALVEPREPAPQSGILGDINIAAGIYVSLDLVGVQPLSFLATVAKIGTSKNLVRLPGAYSKNTKENSKQEKSFSYSAGINPKISLNGRYVSVNGDINCSNNAFPGVWDIQKNTRIIFNDQSTATTATTRCNALFFPKKSAD